MADRYIEKTTAFKNSLRRLSKKHPGLEQIVDEALNSYATDGPPLDRIPGVGGHPVFKERRPLPNRGKRGGLRIISYCDEDRVVGLLLYAKGDRESVPNNVIKDALRNCGLYKSDRAEESA